MDLVSDYHALLEIIGLFTKSAPSVRQGKPSAYDPVYILRFSGNGDLTFDETKSHFTAWALMKAPLVISANV